MIKLELDNDKLEIENLIIQEIKSDESFIDDVKDDERACWEQEIMDLNDLLLDIKFKVKND